jgi:hypothetical protein
MTPKRIQRSRIFKQVSPNGLPIVYVGRCWQGNTMDCGLFTDEKLRSHSWKHLVFDLPIMEKVLQK